MAEAFWGKKKDNRSRVVHLLSIDNFFDMYAAKCRGAIVREEELQYVSDQQLVHFRRCKRCLDAMARDENKTS